MEQHSKAINIFHLLIVFPLILIVIYKDHFSVNVQFITKNLLRILVFLGIINHSIKVIS